jgi:hypothetical protein
MRALGLLLALAASACSTPEERHFRRVGELQCRMAADCTPDEFRARFESVEACIDASEVGVQLYAEACEDFDRDSALRCRAFMREARWSCELDTSDARYEDFCLDVCSNYQGPSEPHE